MKVFHTEETFYTLTFFIRTMVLTQMALEISFWIQTTGLPEKKKTWFRKNYKKLIRYLYRFINQIMHSFFIRTTFSGVRVKSYFLHFYWFLQFYVFFVSNWISIHFFVKSWFFLEVQWFLFKNEISRLIWLRTMVLVKNECNWKNGTAVGLSFEHISLIWRNNAFL